MLLVGLTRVEVDAKVFLKNLNVWLIVPLFFPGVFLNGGCRITYNTQRIIVFQTEFMYYY